MNILHEQGRAAYKRGDYKQAISLYDRAIGHAPSVSLLDGRAACHEKLDDFQAALKDAKKIIQLQREDPTGYLRAGKILIKMNKEPVALEIYTHGMRCIKHVGQGYELLRQAYGDLLSKLSPMKSVDPLTMLPRELAEQILGYLSFKQRMNACLVSKPWTQFIRSCPDLWQHLDLSSARGKVRTAFVSRAINTARRKLTKATLDNLYDLEKTLAAVVQHCPLEDLTLLRTGLQTSGLHTVLASAKHLKRLALDRSIHIPASELRLVIRALAGQLEHLECKVTGGPYAIVSTSMPKLRTLSITIVSHNVLELTVFQALLQYVPALESLTLHNDAASGHANMTHSETVNLRDLPLKYIDLRLGLSNAASIELPSTVTTLSIVCANATSFGAQNFWFGEGPTGLVPLTYHLPSLQVLHLEIPGMVIHNTRHALEVQVAAPQNADSIPASKLRSLTLLGAKLNYLQTSELFKHPRLRELQELRLPQLQSCCDDDVTGIVECLSDLQTLDLSENDITGVGVRKAVQCGTLKELTVNNCRKLGCDAVEWARQQGVRVNYRMSDGSAGGRKVRK